MFGLCFVCFLVWFHVRFLCLSFVWFDLLTVVCSFLPVSFWFGSRILVFLCFSWLLRSCDFLLLFNFTYLLSVSFCVWFRYCRFSLKYPLVRWRLSQINQIGTFANTNVSLKVDVT